MPSDLSDNKALIIVDTITSINYHNVNVEYYYDEAKHCKIYRSYFGSFLFDYVEVRCANPQIFLLSYGNSQLSDIRFNMNILKNTTNVLRQSVADNLNISVDDAFFIHYMLDFSFFGLVNNLGETDNKMKLINVSIKPFTFHQMMILSEKTIILENVVVLRDNILYQPNQYYNRDSKYYAHKHVDAQSFLFMLPSVATKHVSITNCSIIGIRSATIKVHGEVETLEILNSHFEYAESFILIEEGGFVSNILIKDSVFKNAYGKMFDVDVNIANMTINSSDFTIFGTDGLLEIGAAYSKSINNIVLKDNMFKYRDEYTFSDFESEYIRFHDTGEQTKHMMAMINVVNIYVVSNYFGYYGSINYRTLDVQNSSICLSNNTFFNWAIETYHVTNIDSCYRQHLLQHCNNPINDTDLCCNKYGEIDSGLSDKMGYFILNDSVSVPITVPYLTENMILRVALENIMFDVRDDRTDLFLPEISYLLLRDIVINSINYTYLSYNSWDCNMLCNQMINNSLFTQIEMNCGIVIVADHRNDNRKTNILAWTGTKNTTYATPQNLLFIPLNNSLYFPGKFFKFSYILQDQFRNIINGYNQSIHVTTSIQNKGYSSKIVINKTGECFICNSGIYIPSLTLQDDIGQNFSIKMKDESNLFIIPDIEIVISRCPAGYGGEIHCIECPKNSYQLNADTISKCKSCAINNEGFKCNGKDIIMLSQHYYIAIANVSNFDSNVNIFSDNIHIVSNYCPYGMCCQKKDGCDFLRDNKYLCAQNRDKNVPLCGSCNKGFSEVMNSNICVKCNNGLYFEWLSCTFVLSLFIATYLVLSKSEKKVNIQKSNIKCNDKKIINNGAVEISDTIQRLIKNKRFTLMIMFMFSKIIIYYEQSLSQILLSGTIIVNLSTLSSIFDVSIIFYNNNNNNNKWCFITGLTAKSKILSGFISTLMIIILVISLSFIANKIKRINTKIIISKSKSFIALLLLCAGQILSIIFKILSCQSIGNNYSVHFYFGNEECFGISWFLGLIGLGCIMTIFIILFIKLKRMNYIQRHSKINPLHVFIQAFKPNYWYWEGVILLRRIMVIFIAISFKTKQASLFLIVILCFFVIFHHFCQPFIFNELNKIESILLMCLIISVSTQVTLSSESDYLIAYIILSFLIIFPFILSIYYICKSIYQIKNTNIIEYDPLFIFKQRIKYIIFSIFIWYKLSNNQQIISNNDNNDDDVKYNHTSYPTNELQLVKSHSGVPNADRDHDVDTSISDSDSSNIIKHENDEKFEEIELQKRTFRG